MKTQSKIRIAIAEDHGMLRAAYRNMLLERNHYRIMHEAANGQELLDNLAKIVADIVLLDLDMPVMSGKEAFDRIRVLYPETRIIIISAHYDRLFLSHYFSKGVNGYLSKNAGSEEFFETIDTVMREGLCYPEALSKLLLLDAMNDHQHKDSFAQLNLNELELKILKMICNENPTKVIAGTLGLSVYSVDNHRRNILAKTKQSNLIGLFKFALRNGIAEPQ